MLGSSEFNRAGKLRKMILKKSSLVSNINRKYMKYLYATVLVNITYSPASCENKPTPPAKFLIKMT